MAKMNEDLVKKLYKEQIETEKLLACDNLSDALQPVKQNAERKLLALTGPAIDVLGNGLYVGLPADRRASATAILDRSPATKPQLPANVSDQTLPVAAFELLITGLGKLLGSVPAPLKQAELQSTRRSLPRGAKAPLKALSLKDEIDE